MLGDSATASSKNRSALIVGSTGQDGYYLGQSLGNDGVDIVGVNRAGVTRGGPPEPFSILDAAAVGKLVAECRPSQIYYLAAHHRSAQDAPEGISESLENSYATHVRGLVHFLDAIRDECPESRLFYAASSHVFGSPVTAPQNEETPFLPVNVYGVTKAAGIQLCRLYRRQHGLHCSVGILYNHESPRRSPAFVGRKIVQSAVAIKNGQMDKLTLGDLSAEIDWGSALDYVEAMRAILAHNAPDDFVIASGELHSIGDFVDIAFGALALDPQKHIEVNPGLITKSGQARPLVGDASKLREATGWAPKMSFEKIILSMISAEQAA
jgi:GDPmannose 4,6-dehydratase